MKHESTDQSNALITSYFAEPNFINTTDKHVGSMLRIYPWKISGYGFTPPLTRLTELVRGSFRNYWKTDIGVKILIIFMKIINNFYPIDYIGNILEKLQKNSTTIRTFTNIVILKFIEKSHILPRNQLPENYLIFSHLAFLMVGYISEFISEAVFFNLLPPLKFYRINFKNFDAVPGLQRISLSLQNRYPPMVKHQLTLQILGEFILSNSNYTYGCVRLCGRKTFH